MAYYGLGKKEDIFVNLEVEIRKVTGIKTVEWQRTDRKGVSQHRYPGIFVNDLRVDRKQMLKNIWQNTHTIMLVGFVWATQSENLGTKMNTFIVNVKQKVLVDPSRNNNAYDTNIETIATDGGSFHPQGQFIMSLIVTYYTRE